MSATVEIDYEVGDAVQIIPFARNGIVVTVWITRHGIQYEVRYFDNAKVESVYFYANELKRITNGEVKP